MNKPIPRIFAVVNMIKQKCHCGRPQITKQSKHWPYRIGLCETCAKVRCDIEPLACNKVWEFQRIWGPEGRLSINTKNKGKRRAA